MFMNAWFLRATREGFVSPPLVGPMLGLFFSLLWLVAWFVVSVVALCLVLFLGLFCYGTNESSFLFDHRSTLFF